MSTKKQIGLSSKHSAKDAMDLLLPLVQHIFPGQTPGRSRKHKTAAGIEDVFVGKGSARNTKDRLSIGFIRTGYSIDGTPGKLWVRVASTYGTSCVNFREYAISDLDVALSYLAAVDAYFAAQKALALAKDLQNI